jgi:hypothetical protein
MNLILPEAKRGNMQPSLGGELANVRWVSGMSGHKLLVYSTYCYIEMVRLRPRLPSTT